MLLVVWHHATLAYSITGSGVLITDSDKFAGFDLIALYNDSFFMFSFFFVSGLYSYKALLKKGAVEYLEERLLRLMLPFAFGTLFINPVAHYFSFIKRENTVFSMTGYIRYLIENFGRTEANHLWFLWLLFLFSIILVLYERSKRLMNLDFRVNQEKYVANPYRFTIIMLAAGLILFLPLRNIAEGGFATLIKPFNMQVSRILLYFLYFAAGNVIGMYGMKNSFLYHDKFRNKWWLFLLLSFGFTGLNIVIHVFGETMSDGLFKSIVLIVEQSMIVVISLLSLYGFMSLFTSYIKGNSKIMNVLADEAMGIYVIHYAVVTVIQYVVSFVVFSAIAKGVFSASVTIIISLVLVKLLKKIPVIGTIFGKACEPAYRKTLIVVTLIMVFLLMYL